MRTKILLVGIAIIFSGVLYAQQIKLISGNLDFLNGQAMIQTEYDYEGMAVGKYYNEENYLAEIVNKRNEDKPGSGDEWREAWYNDRTERFHPAFEVALNKKLKKRGVAFWELFEDTKYTLLMKITRTEPGYNYGWAAARANISVNIIFIETNNPDKELAIIVIPLCEGTQLGNIANRIEKAYKNCGEELGKYLSKQTFNK